MTVKWRRDPFLTLPQLLYCRFNHIRWVIRELSNGTMLNEYPFLTLPQFTYYLDCALDDTQTLLQLALQLALCFRPLLQVQS